MNIRCGLDGDSCPERLNICCHVCEHKESCMSPCDTHWECCGESEVIKDELATFEASAPEAIQKITNLVVMKKQLEDQEKLLKEELLKAMEAYGVKSFENEQIKLMYVAPTTRTTIDSIGLKKDHPDLAQQYSKTSNVSASVRITVK